MKYEVINESVIIPWSNRKLRKIIGWTSWYCTECPTIIYNTDLYARYRIGAHKRKHK